MKFKSFSAALTLILALPFAFVGGIWLQYFMGVKFSTAVWVGYLAVFGISVEDGIVMVEYLLLQKEAGQRGRTFKETVSDAAVLRVRAITMTTATTILALMAIMLSTGTGSEVMKPIAAPAVGGMVTATLTNLIIVPVLFYWLNRKRGGQE
jgi:Cu(I)/Ag(I) efflux system membrane protein CusA/SilA